MSNQGPGKGHHVLLSKCERPESIQTIKLLLKLQAETQCKEDDYWPGQKSYDARDEKCKPYKQKDYELYYRMPVNTLGIGRTFIGVPRGKGKHLWSNLGTSNAALQKIIPPDNVFHFPVTLHARKCQATILQEGS